MRFYIEIFKKTFEDFFTAKMMFFTFIPLIFCTILWIIMLGVGTFYLTNLNLIQILESHFEIFQGDFILKNIIEWLLIAILIILGFFLSVWICIFLTLIIIGFLTPFIVDFVKNRHYFDIIIHQKISYFYVLKIMILDFLKFLGLLFCSLILYLLPFIGSFVASICVFLSCFFLYYRFIITDIRSNVLGKNQFFNKCNKKSYKISIFIFYCLLHIPIFGFLLQIAFVIFLIHLVYQNEMIINKEKTCHF